MVLSKVHGLDAGTSTSEASKHHGVFCRLTLNQHWDVNNICIMNMLIPNSEISRDSLHGLCCSLLGFHMLHCKGPWFTLLKPNSLDTALIAFGSMIGAFAAWENRPFCSSLRCSWNWLKRTGISSKCGFSLSICIYIYTYYIYSYKQ